MSSNFSENFVIFPCLACSVKFVRLAKSAKFMSSRKPVGSTITARGLAANQPSGSEKNYTVYSLFCIFIIIGSSSINSSISFAVILNCLYLHPRVLSFVHSPPQPTGRKGKGE